MKVNLILNDPAAARPGYLNVDPMADGADARVYGHANALDPLVADAEASEVLALDVLDFLPPSLSGECLAHWVRKLRHGGTLSVGGLDLVEAARLVASRRLNNNDANLLIYGPQSRPCEARKAAASLAVVADRLRSRGLSVVTKTCRGPHYLVTAKRP